MGNYACGDEQLVGKNEMGKWDSYLQQRVRLEKGRFLLT